MRKNTHYWWDRCNTYRGVRLPTEPEVSDRGFILDRHSGRVLDDLVGKTYDELSFLLQSDAQSA